MICGLSYAGDVRMGIAEDGGKVAKIVEGSRAGLMALYEGSLTVRALFKEEMRERR
jgi:hypothetical protein